MQQVYRLLQETNDSELLDLLLVWAENVLEYRNGGIHSSINVMSGGKLVPTPPGWFGFGMTYASVIDGKLFMGSDAWGFNCWSTYTYFMEYVYRVYNRPWRSHPVSAP